MGGGRFDDKDWTKYTTTSNYASKSTREIFTSSKIDKDLDPKDIKIRESRDSAANPNSNAIIIALDETGSMGMVADSMIRKGLPTLVTEIYTRKPVTDPHVMCMGIGDAEYDSAPLQVTQFEAEAIPLITQVEKIYLEGGGGGNQYESYSLAWLFAATKTSIDCFEKRQKKGYIFTVGDEGPTKALFKRDLDRVFGTSPLQGDELDMNQLLTLVSRQWEVYHIIVAEGSHARGHGPENVRKQWAEYLGQRAIILEDHTKMAEVIVSTIQIAEGADHKTVADSWDGSTSVVVRNATKDLTSSGSKSDGGVVSL